MDKALDRRNEQRERVPLQLPVELGHGDFVDPFNADARDLSRGGIAMRAACLPDIGSRLLCRFTATSSGAEVVAQGEVVWAHLDGERSGEFGLAFVDLDAKTEWLIEEMIAEHAVHHPADAGLESHAEPSAEIATLELEGGVAAIAARLASTGAGRAVFEQQLDLLRLGRGVRTHAPGASGDGSISKVELRMVGSVPMLAVTVAFGDPVAAPAATSEPENHEYARDTEPDLQAPVLADEPAPPTPSERVKLEAPSRAERVARIAAEIASHQFEPEPAPPEPARAEPAAEPSSPPALSPPSAPAASPRDHSTAFKLPPRAAQPVALDDEPDLDFDLDAMSAPPWKPALLRALRLLWQVTQALSTQARSAAHVAYRKSSPRLRGSLLRAASVVRGVYGEQVAPQLGALRRLAAAQLVGRRRRKTAGPSQARPAAAPTGSLGRTLLLGVLGACAAALAVYALVPSGSDDDIELHRKVVAAPAAPAPDSVAQPAAAPEPPPAKPDPAIVPSAKQVPASSPFAVDVRGKSAAPPRATVTATAAAAPTMPATPATTGKLRFGSASVPNGRRFALRMSNKVKDVQGVADEGGFTVSLIGSLSLDRAGPISSAHKSVQRAMVINRGDRADLSIRFADGKHPAYQVSAEGTTVYIVIQDG